MGWSAEQKAEYLGKYKDVANSGLDAEQHYNRWGKSEGRSGYSSGGGGGLTTGGGGGGGYRGTYQEYLSYGGKASEAAYNAAAPQGGQSGGGGNSNWQSSLTPQGYSPNQSGGSKYSTGQALAGGLVGGAGAGAGFIAAGGLGKMGALASMGPAGWAIGGGLLAFSALKGKKNKSYFEQGTNTGDVKNGYQQVSNSQAPVDWDAYAKANPDLGAALADLKTQGAGSSDSKYWQNRASSIGAGKIGNMNDAQFSKLHYQFDAQGEGGRAAEYRLPVAQAKAAPSSGGKSRSRSAPAPTASKAPPAKLEDKIKEITKPGSGLEDTIKKKPPPSYLYPERLKKTFLSAGKKDDEESGSFLSTAG